MTTTLTATHEEIERNTKAESKVVFGFWLYIMSDCILFASLFAAYAVLHNHTFGGISMHQLASLPDVFMETMALLFSSFAYGIAFLSLYKGDKNRVVFWLGAALIFGLVFLGLELNEFVHLVQSGNSWQRSAFLSSFFTLVGTHGLHVTLGSIWMLTLMWQVHRNGINPRTTTRLTCLGIFWSFLDIVWIFLFTIVYLMGVI